MWSKELRRAFFWKCNCGAELAPAASADIHIHCGHRARIELAADAPAEPQRTGFCGGGPTPPAGTADPAAPALKQEVHGVGYLWAESMALSSSYMRWEDSGTIT